VGSGLERADVQALAVDPSNPQILHAGLLNGSVFTVTLPGARSKDGDIDGDGDVDFDDFFLFASAFGRSRGQAGFTDRADINGDGRVDFDDFFLFAAAFGK